MEVLKPGPVIRFPSQEAFGVLGNAPGKAVMNAVGGKFQRLIVEVGMAS